MNVCLQCESALRVDAEVKEQMGVQSLLRKYGYSKFF